MRFVSKPADLSCDRWPAIQGPRRAAQGFIAAGTNFNVGVQALNALGGTTPNFRARILRPKPVKVTFVALDLPDWVAVTPALYLVGPIV